MCPASLRLRACFPPAPGEYGDGVEDDADVEGDVEDAGALAVFRVAFVFVLVLVLVVDVGEVSESR